MSCKEIKIIVTSGFRHFVRICSYLLDAVTTIVMHPPLFLNLYSMNAKDSMLFLLHTFRELSLPVKDGVIDVQ